jgi:hypothetical protein
LLYRLLCFLVGVLARGGCERELEIVVLRHQLAILRRGGKRPQYTTVDRALLAAVSRLLPPERWSCFVVSPQTLRRWHRALLQGHRRGRHRRPGRPPLAAEMRGDCEDLQPATSAQPIDHQPGLPRPHRISLPHRLAAGDETRSRSRHVCPLRIDSVALLFALFLLVRVFRETFEDHPEELVQMPQFKGACRPR